MTLMKIGYAVVVTATAVAFVLGAPATGEAKAKKKMEAAPTPPACQLAPSQTVCGVKGGMKFTYANACYAERDGAKVASAGACKAKTAKMGGKKKKKKM